MNAAHDTNSTAAQTSTTALARVTVDAGHDLYTAPDGAHLARDLDLANWAGLIKPHTIRSTIEKAVSDGALIISHGVGNDAGPAAREVTETVTIGKGAQREVKTWYLNESGALLVATRLRTARAVAMTREVLTTFTAMKRGTLAHVAPTAPANDTNIAALIGAVTATCDVLRAQNSTIAALLGALVSAAPKPPPAAPAAPAALPAPAPAPKPAPAAPATQTAVATDTGRWLRASTIAARAQAELGREVTAYGVGLAMSTLGMRADTNHCRTKLIDVRGDVRESCEWSPTAQRAAIRYLAGQAPARVQRIQRARDRRADIAEGAQQVLDGLGA